MTLCEKKFFMMASPCKLHRPPSLDCVSSHSRWDDHFFVLADENHPTHIPFHDSYLSSEIVKKSKKEPVRFVYNIKYYRKIIKRLVCKCKTSSTRSGDFWFMSAHHSARRRFFSRHGSGMCEISRAMFYRETRIFHDVSFVVAKKTFTPTSLTLP